jgi:hypothetical protein
MTAQDPGRTGGQIGALEMMAGRPDGCTEAALKANGFCPQHALPKIAEGRGSSLPLAARDCARLRSCCRPRRFSKELFRCRNGIFAGTVLSARAGSGSKVRGYRFANWAAWLDVLLDS